MGGCTWGPQEYAQVPKGMEGPSLGIPVEFPEQCWGSLQVMPRVLTR